MKQMVKKDAKVVSACKQVAIKNEKTCQIKTKKAMSQAKTKSEKGAVAIVGA